MIVVPHYRHRIVIGAVYSISMNEKKAQRHEALTRRDAITPEIRAQKSIQICRKLEELVLQTCQKTIDCVPALQKIAEGFSQESAPCVDRELLITLYAAMRSEVNLEPFIERAYHHNWSLCFPAMVVGTPDSVARMTFFRVSKSQFPQAKAEFLDHPLRKVALSELHEAGLLVVAPQDVDVVVVPLVAFDDQGRRLGYGGGNYDRFLSQVGTDTLVVGVAFNEQRVHFVYTEPHDLSLQHILYA